jgi:hypothetical protein
MRNSVSGLLIRLLLGFGLGLLSLFVCQKIWLAFISYQITQQTESGGLPVGTMPVSGLSFPTARPPAPVGSEVTFGNFAITVTRFERPANAQVAKAGYKTLEKDEEYLLVDIRVRCISASETCRLTEFDFGVESSSGRDYPAEFSTSFSDLPNLFEGGDIAPGKKLSGSLIFIIHKEDSGLSLSYPRMAIGVIPAKFLLGR